jgi:hypothetical protein
MREIVLLKYDIFVPLKLLIEENSTRGPSVDLEGRFGAIGFFSVFSRVFLFVCMGFFFIYTFFFGFLCFFGPLSSVLATRFV